jgi:charged multivesicular body protein 7
MSRDKPHLSYSPETSTIKFALPHTSTLPQITENDISIASIKSLLHTLELAIPPLEERAIDLDVKARDAVAKKQRSTALSLLRSKKLVEGTLEKRRNNFLQLEETLSRIEQASDQVEIVQAMKTSTTVLRSLNEQVGGVEGVERVTDALREEMEKGNDITNVLNEPGQVVQEEDVDEEFEALMDEERAKEEAIERAAREKKEGEEAEATKRKMDELDRFEKERAAERAEQEAAELRSRVLASKERETTAASDSTLAHVFPSHDATKQDEEPALEASVKGLGKLSLDETRPDLTERQESQEKSKKEERESPHEMISAS